MERQWQWEAAHVIEHLFLAKTLSDGSHTLVQVVKCSANGSVAPAARHRGTRQQDGEDCSDGAAHQGATAGDDWE